MVAAVTLRFPYFLNMSQGMHSAVLIEKIFEGNFCIPLSNQKAFQTNVYINRIVFHS